MAISAVHYQLLKEHSHLLKRGGSLLEIGEANWYGDMDPYDMIATEYDSRTRSDFHSIMSAGDLFCVAKAAYRILWHPSIIESVDMNGTPAAFKQNLNAPLTLPRQYDTVINHGTAEHIFNIAQLFASIHQATKICGYMIHEAPFTGWIDHGFYCLQPTLFYDLAAANGYELVSLSITHITTRQIVRLESREMCHRLAPTSPKDAMLFAVMKQTTAEPFRIPMQGYYDGTLSKEGMEAWHTR